MFNTTSTLSLSENFNFKKILSYIGLLSLFLYSFISFGQESYVKRINCGYNGSTNVTVGGDTFYPDNFYSTSEVEFSSNTTTANPGQVTLAEPYRTLRLTYGSSFTYTFKNLIPGNKYKVILHFAEPWHGVRAGTNPNTRIFDVNINNEFSYNNLSIMSAAAGPGAPIEDGKNKVYKINEDATAVGTQLTITFTEDANDPIINAIEVIGIDTSDNQSPTAPSLSSNSITSTTADLNWNGATDNVGVTNYKIYKDGALETTVGNVATYQVTGLTEATSYALTLRAVDAAGNESSSSNTETITTSSTGGGNSVWMSSGDDINYTNGNVGIKTSAQSNYALAVGGHIIGEEVKVQLQADWPDYVFANQYDLPTLEEVQNHINQKGHLINIPTATEVEANGLELGEMNRLLLEKIEELTLYLIELNKEVNTLKEFHRE